jgi:hypothetical protein
MRGRKERQATKHDFPTPPARFRGIGYTHAPDGMPLVAFDLFVPKPGADELLVHVVASSLNPLDYKLADLNFRRWPNCARPYATSPRIRTSPGPSIEAARGAEARPLRARLFPFRLGGDASFLNVRFLLLLRHARPDAAATHTRGVRLKGECHDDQTIRDPWP